MRDQGSHDNIVVFRQSRDKLFGIAAIGIGFVVMGVSFILHPELWSNARHSPESVEFMGWVSTPFFSLCLVGAAASLVRPAKVELGPNGLTIATAWRTYSRPWDAVSDFEIREYKRNRTVIFNDDRLSNRRLAEINRRLTGATSALPTALNARPEDVLAAIAAAKARWGGNDRSLGIPQ